MASRKERIRTMATRTESIDEAVRTLSGIRDVYEEIQADVHQLRALGCLLEAADFRQIGGLTEEGFGRALNSLIERILDGQEIKLDKIYSGALRVQEIIEHAEGPKHSNPEPPKD